MNQKLDILMNKIGMPNGSLNLHQIRYSFGRKIYDKTRNL